MKRVFSPELITRAKRIFEARSGRAVSEEETEIYLEKLATLGILAQKVISTEKNSSKKIIHQKIKCYGNHK